jgi:hypothetical protein
VERGASGRPSAEYYEYRSVYDFLRSKGVMKECQASDHVHDAPAVEIEVRGADPDAAKERVKANLATTDGVWIEDKKPMAQWARDVAEFRATKTIAAMRKAIDARGGLAP